MNDIETIGWKTYKNDKYRFAISYPGSWTTKEETQYDAGLIKEKYRLDIFYPENMDGADVYGNIAIEYFIQDDNKKFFDRQLDLIKKDSTLTIKEVIINRQVA